MHHFIDSFNGQAFGSFAWNIHNWIKAQKVSKPILIVTNTQQEQETLEKELSYYGHESLVFPDWEILPYDNFSPHQDIISSRLKVLSLLGNSKHEIVLVQVNTLMHRLLPKTYLDKYTFYFTKGQKFLLQEYKTRLVDAGYLNLHLVLEHGQFSVRGSILDIFPMGLEQPIRIDIEFDEIIDLKYFDPESQLSNNSVDQIMILPAKEYSFDEEGIINFRANWRELIGGIAHTCQMYQDVTNNLFVPGLEYYLHLFFGSTATLFDYLPNTVNLILLSGLSHSVSKFNEYYLHRYEQYRHDVQRPILSPNHVFIAAKDLFDKVNTYNIIDLVKNNNFIEAKKINLQINNNDSVQEFILKINALIAENKVIFSFESVGRKVLMQELLVKHKIKHVITEHILTAINNSDYNLHLISSPISNGFQEQGFILFTEFEIFGFRVVHSNKNSQTKTVDIDNIVKNLADLQIGTPVVHLQHGIGLYTGLTKMTISDIEAEYVTIEYQDSDKIYLPVSNLHMISRYSASNLDDVALHSLRTTKWQQQKNKVAWQIKDTAAELLATYAKRDIVNRNRYIVDLESYHRFTADFPYAETKDQASSIQSILSDLQSDRPMDRVICGDVGFGKTEVAMRAAFIVANNNKQVAVLVPTTLLADQHGQTFLDRFANFPLNIEVVSRFKTNKEIKQILDKLSEGKIDIIIGTHKLLQDDVKFKDLGLIIIDEEHRFGVQQKEKFKSLRAKIDMIALTATPIPRTLNLALASMRDLSIIATPPKSRLSVKTFVRQRNKILIQEAVVRELNRAGQVFFVHNKIETMEIVAHEIRELVPQAKVAIAHGQLNERELEQVMLNFYHRNYNVLLCTTIIETGIDMPNVNTIIIDRADMFGLAQLHQLRGRVGRSHHQAYAFLLHPESKSLTKDASLRLDAISRYDSLGAGFALATNDMEIRGAGELLGEEQSGNINTIGFTLFMELLARAVDSLKDGHDFNFESLIEGIDLQIQVPALIPDSYIIDVQLRLNLYKRISNAANIDELLKLKIEIIDRFGPIPEEMQFLFDISEFRIMAKGLNIVRIKFGKTGGYVEFNKEPNIDHNVVIKLIQQQPKEYMLTSNSILKIIKNFTKPIQVINFISDFLNKIKIK